MPVSDNFRFNIKFPGLLKGSPRPQLVMAPAPEILAMEGPTLDVLIGVTEFHAKYLEDNGKSVPQPMSGKAMIDTGASVTVVDVEIMKHLGACPIGVALVGTPQGKDLQEKYPAKISFPGTGLGSVQSGSVLGSPAIGEQGLAALIGRDLLKHWLIIYNGPAGNTTIAS